MNKKLLLLINSIMCFFFIFQANAFIPKSIEIDENIFFDDIMLDYSYKNWQYFPFEFDATGLKKIISIENVHKKPKLITTNLIQKKNGWFPSVFKMCIPDLLNFHDSSNEFNELDVLKSGILGRYVLKFEIICKKFEKKHLVISTNYYFMLYKQNKNQRISNLEANFGNQRDINIVLQEKEIDMSDGEDCIDEDVQSDEEVQFVVNKEYLNKKVQFNYNFLNCFLFSWRDVFGCY
jgi:hypothetical protein